MRNKIPSSSLQIPNSIPMAIGAKFQCSFISGAIYPVRGRWWDTNTGEKYPKPLKGLSHAE
jgi:hypothetical protein